MKSGTNIKRFAIQFLVTRGKEMIMCLYGISGKFRVISLIKLATAWA